MREVAYEDRGWQFELYANKQWKIYRHPTNHVVMTGSDVPTELFIKFPHRFNRMEVYHHDSSDTASTDSMKIIVRRAAGTLKPKVFQQTLFEEEKIIDDEVTEKFGIGFEYEAGLWVLILDTTSTDRVTPVFYIQELAGVHS